MFRLSGSDGGSGKDFVSVTHPFTSTSETVTLNTYDTNSASQTFDKTFSQAYTGTYTRDRTSTFARGVDSSYTRDFTGDFIGNYSRPHFFTGDFVGDYTGQVDYTRDFTRVLHSPETICALVLVRLQEQTFTPGLLVTLGIMKELLPQPLHVQSLQVVAFLETSLKLLRILEPLRQVRFWLSRMAK